MSENKYSRGKIYQILCGDLTYYGSTIQPLSKRLSGHRQDYKCWIRSNKPPAYYISSYDLFEIGEPKIYLVEEYKCENKEQLESREGFHIKNNKCVNKCIPGQGRQEVCKNYYEKNHEHYKEYRENHKEDKKEYDLKYRAENIDKRKEQRKQQYQNNSEEAIAKTKEWAKNNPEKIKARNTAIFTCECGYEGLKCNSARHLKSKKHLKLISDIKL